MLEQLHKHITAELNQNARTDIIFLLAAIVLNLILLAVSSGSIEQSRTKNTFLVVLFIFVVLVILINIVAILDILKGKQ